MYSSLSTVHGRKQPFQARRHFNCEVLVVFSLCVGGSQFRRVSSLRPLQRAIFSSGYSCQFDFPSPSDVSFHDILDEAKFRLEEQHLIFWVASSLISCTSISLTYDAA